MIRAILTDIEGTTSSLSVLKELLAPYARAHLRAFVAAQRERSEVQAALADTRVLASEPDADEERLLTILERWIDQDKKAPPLKVLQGLVWERGYRDGTLRAHVFDDVAPALRALRARGLHAYVYSSGSILAQQLFFEHTSEGDLRGLFDGYFDTGSGAKGEPASYLRIASAIGHPPSELLFLSDAQAELDAARAAGLSVLGVMRPDNPALRGHAIVSSFAQLPSLVLGAGATPSSERPSYPAVRASELIALARFAHQRGWALATSGNFSLRTAADRVLITASGRDKGALHESDLVSVDLLGKPLDAQHTPSAETPLHCALYRADAATHAVAHTHSRAATVLSRRYLARGALTLTGFEMLKALPGIHSHEQTLSLPVVANSQDMEQLEQRVSEALAKMPDAVAYLVAGHGLTTWAKDLASVKRQLEALEFLLECQLAEEPL